MQRQKKILPLEVLSTNRGNFQCIQFKTKTDTLIPSSTCSISGSWILESFVGLVSFLLTVLQPNISYFGVNFKSHWKFLLVMYLPRTSYTPNVLPDLSTIRLSGNCPLLVPLQKKNSLTPTALTGNVSSFTKQTKSSP